MRREAGSSKILVDLWKLIIPELRVLVLTKRHVGSGNEIARANERARAQNVRDFPQTKPDSEINARFLLNEHGDPHFLFYKFNENNVFHN